MNAKTPQQPYYAVIFTSILKDGDKGYEQISNDLEKLVRIQPGFLGFELAREETGITVSYWKDLESIQNWKENSVHSIAFENGRKNWYETGHFRL